jgi:hypothetical protein
MLVQEENNVEAQLHYFQHLKLNNIQDYINQMVKIYYNKKIK